MKVFINLITLLLCSIHWGMAQVPAPADAQGNPILITGGTIHVGNGEVFENGAVAFAEGKITYVGEAADFSADQSSYEVIDASGKHIYPGFIIPNTTLGLVEIGAVNATVDQNEIGNLNPNVRSIIAYNTDSEIIPTMRFNGILLAQTTPVGGRIPGTSSIVGLDAWNWEDAVIKMDDAVHLNWPGRYKYEFDYSDFSVKRVKNDKYEEQLKELNELFSDAQSYASQSAKKENLKLEAMLGLLDGKKALHIHVDDAKGIIESIQFTKKYGIQKIAIVGGEEALLVKDIIKENNTPVLLSDVHRLPNRPEEDVDMPYKLPYLLHKEGIKVGLTYNSVTNSRNLPFFAGTAAGYGLSKEEALKMISLNTAEILGISEQFGSIESGKNATLFISGGDALDMRGNLVEKAFISGRSVELNAMQQRLYKKYKAKYEAGK